MAEETASQGNIRAEYNNATVGLNLDRSVNQIEKGQLTYALNAAVENFDANSVNYQNEPGNELCFQFPDGYQLIGEHFINEKSKHVFFLANPITGDSEIGYMDNNDCIYHTYINAKCLNFNINYPIHKAVHKITNCTTEVYWTDGYNPRRYLDLEKIPYKLQSGANLCDPIYTNEIDCNKLNVQPEFNIPQLEVVSIENGGDLLAGTYQFAIQYSDSVSQGYTSYYSVTNPTPIADTNITTINFNYPVGKSIKVKVSNLDITGLYKYYNLAVIKTINGITSVELVGTYFINDNEDVITYTGQNKSDIRLTSDDIFIKYPYYEVAQDITVARDVLIWDNLSSIDRINFQQIANQIQLQWETWRIPANENYSDELNATNLRGYLRDEVYAFEIVFLLKNGKQTDGFHIPGRAPYISDLNPVPDTNFDFIGSPDYQIGSVGYSPWWKIYNTATLTGFSPSYSPAIDYKGPYQYGDFAYWESTERYPCNKEVWGALADQPIRHHKFPDVKVSPIFESALFNTTSPLVMQDDAVFPMGVRIDVSYVATLIANSSLTQEQKDNIAGFKIVRGDRGPNKSVVAKGILRNVGKYEKDETEYYFANYPYNDLREDPFLLEKNNAFTANAEISNSLGGICRSYNYIVYKANTTIRYVDCYTNETVDIGPFNIGETGDVCAIGAPQVTAGEACITSNTYKIWRISNNAGFLGSDKKFLYVPPTDGGLYAPPVGYTSWCEYCHYNPTDSNCKDEYGNNPRALHDVAITISAGNSYDVPSLTKPTFISGLNKDYTIEEIDAVGFNICPPRNLNAFWDNSLKYRQIFNSPETSFGQPFLGDVLKLENVMFGGGKAHFVQVKKNAMYKLVTQEAQTDALFSSAQIAGITLAPLDPAVLFAGYEAYLTIYINAIIRRNYGYSFNSIASYDYSADIDNGLGIKQRPLDVANYLIPEVQSVGSGEQTINNFQRESSVYLKTSERVITYNRSYGNYNVCKVSGFLASVIAYTDITTGATVVTSVSGGCKNINSFTTPVVLFNNSGTTVTQISTSTTSFTGPIDPFLFPSDTPSLASTGLVDNSRFVLGDGSNPNATCSAPGKEVPINTVAYYASIKSINATQYGQIYSYQTIDTGFQRDITPLVTPTYETVFGGDTFISRFAFKTKLPFFFDNRVNAPDDSDIFYDEVGNVAYPKYWFSSRSILNDVTVAAYTLRNFISFKAHNFDCPNSQTPQDSPGRTYYDGKMYLFAYGVPYFYCESSYNVDLRQAFNTEEGDFWPHVSNSIPDDWVQESNVPIAQDNTYYYNVTYSKQNKENVFTHLPSDWKELCYTNYPFRAIYSDVQETDADNRANNWLIYRPVSYFDFPQNYGKLTSLDGIQNKAVLARFENKSLLYNSLLTIDTSNPKAAYIGNSRLFDSAPPIDFAETDLGYVGSQHKMLLKIPQGQVTVDAKRGQVFLVSGNEAVDLSAFGSGLNRFFTDHLAFEILRYFPNVNVDNHFNGLGLHGVYDSKYDRVIITKLDYIPKSDKIKYDPITKEFYIQQIVQPSSSSSTTTTTNTTTINPACNNCAAPIKPPMPGAGSVTISGVSITGTSTNTAALSTFPGPFSIIPACLPPGFYNLMGGGGVTPANPSGSFINWNYTMNFSQPVYSVTLRLINYTSSTVNGTIDGQEGIYFTTSAGVPNVDICSACNVEKVGNLVKAKLIYDPQGGITGLDGSGSFLISSSTPFTSLTLTPFQGAANQNALSSGLLFDVCNLQTSVSTTTTSTTTTSIPPVPIVTREVVYLTDEEYFCNRSWTLSFNFNTKSWISFHSYIPNWYIAENNFFYSGQNDCCSSFDALVGIPTANTTTTTTSSTTTSTTSTTTTTTTAYIGCVLAGDACEQPITTTTTTSTSTSTTTTSSTSTTTTTTSTSTTTTTTTSYLNNCTNYLVEPIGSIQLSWLECGTGNAAFGSFSTTLYICAVTGSVTITGGSGSVSVAGSCIL